jgi:hypothetical protein
VIEGRVCHQYSPLLPNLQDIERISQLKTHLHQYDWKDSMVGSLLNDVLIEEWSQS